MKARVKWQGIWIKVASEAEFTKITNWEAKKYSHILKNKFGVDSINDLTDNALKEMSDENFFYCFNRVGIYDPVFWYFDFGTNEIVSHIQSHTQSQNTELSIMMQVFQRNIQVRPFTNSDGVMIDGWGNKNEKDGTRMTVDNDDDNEYYFDSEEMVHKTQDPENKHDG